MSSIDPSGYPSTADILVNVLDKMSDEKKNLFLALRQWVILSLHQLTFLRGDSGEIYLCESSPISRGHDDVVAALRMDLLVNGGYKEVKIDKTVCGPGGNQASYSFRVVLA